MKPTLDIIIGGGSKESKSSGKSEFAKRMLRAFKDDDAEALQIALDAYMDAHMDEMEGAEDEGEEL